MSKTKTAKPKTTRDTAFHDLSSNGTVWVRVVENLTDFGVKSNHDRRCKVNRTVLSVEVMFGDEVIEHRFSKETPNNDRADLTFGLGWKRTPMSKQSLLALLNA